jgi:hypothetical protein
MLAIASARAAGEDACRAHRRGRAGIAAGHSALSASCACGLAVAQALHGATRCFVARDGAAVDLDLAGRVGVAYDGRHCPELEVAVRHCVAGDRAAVAALPLTHRGVVAGGGQFVGSLALAFRTGRARECACRVETLGLAIRTRGAAARGVYADAAIAGAGRGRAVVSAARRTSQRDRDQGNGTKLHRSSSLHGNYATQLVARETAEVTAIRRCHRRPTHAHAQTNGCAVQRWCSAANPPPHTPSLDTHF